MFSGTHRLQLFSVSHYSQTVGPITFRQYNMRMQISLLRCLRWASPSTFLLEWVRTSQSPCAQKRTWRQCCCAPAPAPAPAPVLATGTPLCPSSDPRYRYRRTCKPVVKRSHEDISTGLALHRLCVFHVCHMLSRASATSCGGGGLPPSGLSDARGP